MKKPYTNNTDGIQHVGSVTVMPHSTREVEERDIQAYTGHSDAAKPEESPNNPLALFLSANVKTIANNIADLSAAELDGIETLEKADKNRNGVINAIAEARLVLAAANSSELEQFIDSLDGMSDEELTEQKELYTDEEDSVAYLEAVNTEIENRAGNND